MGLLLLVRSLDFLPPSQNSNVSFLRRGMIVVMSMREEEMKG